MNHKEYKERILNSFGTISAFVRIKNLSKDQERNLRHYFSGKMAKNKVERFQFWLDKKMRPSGKNLDPLEITTQERKTVRSSIFVGFSTVEEFVKKYPEFTQTFVSNVITGRKIRRCSRFDLLFSILRSDSQKWRKEFLKEINK